jgi:hypothetical protein
MKRKITLTMALALGGLLLSLTSSDATVRAQQPAKFRADTGIVTLGPNQVLRVTATAVVDGADFLAVRFRRIQYGPGACDGGVCKLGSVTDLIIDPITLRSGEGASMDLAQAGFNGVRIMVQSNSRNVRATATIINTVTGETTSHIIIANTEGD